MRTALVSTFLLAAACSGANRGNADFAQTPADLAAAVGDLSGAPPAQVVINEVDPNGADPISDPDWIELKNVGSGAVDLSGYTLRDSKPSNASPLPSGSVIAPGAYLVVSCRGNGVDLGAPTGVWMPFKLSGTNGDEVHLAAPGGADLDSTSWTAGAIPAGRSWARLPDGSGSFALATPTRGDVNQP